MQSAARFAKAVPAHLPAGHRVAGHALHEHVCAELIPAHAPTKSGPPSTQGAGSKHGIFWESCQSMPPSELASICIKRRLICSSGYGTDAAVRGNNSCCMDGTRHPHVTRAQEARAWGARGAETALRAVLVEDGPKRVHELLQIQAPAAIRVSAVEALLQRKDLGDGNRAVARTLGVLLVPARGAREWRGGEAAGWRDGAAERERVWAAAPDSEQGTTARQ